MFSSDVTFTRLIRTLMIYSFNALDEDLIHAFNKSGYNRYAFIDMHVKLYYRSYPEIKFIILKQNNKAKREQVFNHIQDYIKSQVECLLKRTSSDNYFKVRHER